jgi:hypothetical protein
MHQPSAMAVMFPVGLKDAGRWSVLALTFSKGREVGFLSAGFGRLQDFKFHTVPATTMKLFNVCCPCS